MNDLIYTFGSIVAAGAGLVAIDFIQSMVVDYRWGRAERIGGQEGLKGHILNSPLSNYSDFPLTERVKREYYGRADMIQE